MGSSVVIHVAFTISWLAVLPQMRASAQPTGYDGREVVSIDARDTDDALHALGVRQQQLGPMYVEIDWMGCPAPRGADPFDSANWQTTGERVLRESYRVWLARPDLKVEVFQAHRPNETWVKNWINGQRFAKARRAGEPWSLSIDANRALVTGPVVFLTPLEMQLFDIPLSLFELAEAGKLHVESETPDSIVLAGDPAYYRLPASLRATLDRTRGLMPLELRLTEASGKIDWTMRTVRSAPIGGTYAIQEAIIALSNSQVSPKYWQIYHFNARRIEARPMLTAKDLEIEMPTADFQLVDYIHGLVRVVDASGRVVHEEQRSPEEMQAAIEAYARARYTKEQEETRRTTAFWVIVASSVVVVALIAGFWLWRQRSP